LTALQRRQERRSESISLSLSVTVLCQRVIIEKKKMLVFAYIFKVERREEVRKERRREEVEADNAIFSIRVLLQ
jgi:hypothetical protein